MGNLLSKYLDSRLEEETPQYKGDKNPGPVITISREVGCNGLKLARLIASKLNSNSTGNKWKVLSKEVFHESAKELNLDYHRVTKVFKKTDKYTFEEILYAFGDRNYKSEKRIVKTVVDIVHSFADDGYCLIVGRAGHIIAKDIENAIHLRLIAPLEYRINTIMANNILSRQQAISFINKVEKERIAFRKALGEEKLREEDFDLVLNRAAFGNDQVVNIIENVVSLKKMCVKQKSDILYF